MFNKINWKKVLVGAGIAGAGAALTYLSAWASGQDFGVWTPAITAVLSVFFNLLRKIQQGEEG